ncbi:MAG: hypothetical protein DBX91_10275 [Subdoligranulum variabile]|nr:MAG: hypothetical protein DBX91_10275 [Subdoligranulum variabile]
MRELKKAVCKLVLVAAGVAMLVLAEAAAIGYWWQAAGCGALVMLAANRAAGGLLPEDVSHDGQ